MPLVNLLNVPKDPDSWESWSFANKELQTEIRQAIQAQHSIKLQEYELYPINFNDFEGWLFRNSQGHNDLNSALNLQSADLSSVNIKDEKQLQVWVQLGYQELFSACANLKI